MSTTNKNVGANARGATAINLERFEEIRAALEAANKENVEIKAEHAKTLAELSSKITECIEQSAKIKELEIVISTFTGEAEKIRVSLERLTELEEENAKLKLANAELTAQLAEAEASVDRAGVAADAESVKDAKDAKDGNFVIIVALPEEGVVVPDLYHKGVRAKKKVDKNGYTHFMVEREHAGILLASTSGLRFALVGPDAEMTVKRQNGFNTEAVKVYRHVFGKTESGAPFWQPVIEEESVQPPPGDGE